MATPTVEELEAEIERLREFLERGGIDSRAVLDGEDDGTWQDENERLQRDLAWCESEFVTKDKEIERLRAALEEIAGGDIIDSDCWDIAREALRDEALEKDKG